MSDDKPTEERCMVCDEPTGRAGKGDDSLYRDDDTGPYCEECFDKPTGALTEHDPDAANQPKHFPNCTLDYDHERPAQCQPTVGLTDEQIDMTFDMAMGDDLPCCDAECPEDYCIHVRRFAARRIEAIVRKDERERLFNGLSSEHYVESIRKDEREQAAGIVRAYEYKPGEDAVERIANAILRGTDDSN